MSNLKIAPPQYLRLFWINVVEVLNLDDAELLFNHLSNSSFLQIDVTIYSYKKPYQKQCRIL